jgi:hypothetical protein
MKRSLFALVALAAVASAACRQYDVDVYRNVNGKVRGADGVSQSFTCTADSLLWADFFVGAANSGGSYEFEVRRPGSATALYTGSAHAGDSIHYQYARAEFTRNQSAPELIKGKEYVLKVTLSSPSQYDSLNFYYDETNPYQYGELSLAGSSQAAWDLACRIEGVNRPVSRELVEKPTSQPDLAVDSVWVALGAGAQVTLHARVRNIGNKQFVAPTTAKGSCLRFYIDGDPVNAVAEPAKLKVGGAATVQSVPASPDRSIMHLVSAEANPNKEVMEPNFDNNARYCPLSAH